MIPNHIVAWKKDDGAIAASSIYEAHHMYKVCILEEVNNWVHNIAKSCQCIPIFRCINAEYGGGNGSGEGVVTNHG